MENASKALLIAGGILVGIITISLLFYMSTKLGETVESVSNNSEQEELLEFNKGFEVYNKKLMYGLDVVNAINKAIDNNKVNDVFNNKNNEYYVDIVVQGYFTLSNYSNYNVAIDEAQKLLNKKILNYDGNETELKKCTFKCSNVEYNTAGRVSKMVFEISGR